MNPCSYINVSRVSKGRRYSKCSFMELHEVGMLKKDTYIYICIYIYIYPIVFSSSSRLSVVVMLSFYDAWDAAENEEFYEAWEAAEAAFSQQRGHEAPSSAGR